MVPVFPDMSSSWQSPHKHFLYCSTLPALIVLRALPNLVE